MREELSSSDTEQKRIEEALSQRNQCFKLKSENSLSYSQMSENLELAEIIDVQAVQSFMDDFYKLAHIPIGIIDLKGNVLVGVGWQDICTKFHRAHPETCKHCVESDIKLSSGVPQGEFKLYKCKNNMWDIVTPIMADEQHIGNIFLGQFFFEDEPVDYELFRSQARKYGFNEEEYIAALKKVPRLSKETVENSMSFFMKLANMLSQLGHSNIKLTQSLEERDSLVDELQDSEERFRSVLENSLDSAYRLDLQNNCFDYMSSVIEKITGFSAKEINEITRNGLLARIHPDDRPLFIAEIAQSLNDGFGANEYRFKCKDGKYHWLADHFSIIKDETGRARFRAGIVRDITERKQTEKALEKAYNVLEEKVKERTAELENAYNSLKESEDRLNALFRLLPVGVSIIDKNRNIMDVNLALERILGLSRSDLIKGKQTARKYLKSDGIEMSFEDFPSVRALKDKGSIQSSEIGIIKEDSSIIWTEVNAIYLPISDGQVVTTTRDITEHRKEEDRIHRYNSVLMGINRIFGGVVRSETERELGSACLSIALGITGSKIGFIVEVGKDGIMHNIAISERDLSPDLMDDRTGHPRFPVDSILHGPYDRIIDTEKSFFTNQWSHPDSIDMPQDHPALKSLLAVPLIQEGKTTGMIVVANREGGYNSEQQEDLEAIAPAVTQALWRKKAEETLAKIGAARQKEIHHRIKNNLQVISSLLDLQAEKFNNRECLENTEIIEAFRESQDRVMSIAFIHEELHEGRGDDALNFSLYLQRLLQNLLQTYRFGNTEICLNLDLEENIFFAMDTAVPLGMIVNELISNSLKYAFSGKE
ncbi:MAG: hypothetical protein QG610_723, partial [Euryarchaeota archaeon]|nr:hypothetical protein [Euryarchaeota archaeon]